MRILIFEGIATSGKSTIIAAIKESVAGLSVIVADEKLTHIPIMQEPKKLHVDFFKRLLHEMIESKPDVLILDRFYLTQALRAHVTVDEYAELEDLLLKYSTLTIYLRVEKGSIAKRIDEATEQRDPLWAEYVKTRGESMQEIANYYMEQQNYQLELLKQSKVPYKIFDTTSHNYQIVVGEIAQLI